MGDFPASLLQAAPSRRVPSPCHSPHGYRCSRSTACPQGPVTWGGFGSLVPAVSNGPCSPPPHTHHSLSRGLPRACLSLGLREVDGSKAGKPGVIRHSRPSGQEEMRNFVDERNPTSVACTSEAVVGQFGDVFLGHGGKRAASSVPSQTFIENTFQKIVCTPPDGATGRP